jgi:hypothetical protein
MRERDREIYEDRGWRRGEGFIGKKKRRVLEWHPER